MLAGNAGWPGQAGHDGEFYETETYSLGTRGKSKLT